MKRSLKDLELDIRNFVIARIHDGFTIPTVRRATFSCEYSTPTYRYRYERHTKRDQGWWGIYHKTEDGRSKLVGAYNKAMGNLLVLKGSFVGRALARTFYQYLPTVKITDSTEPEIRVNFQ